MLSWPRRRSATKQVIIGNNDENMANSNEFYPTEEARAIAELSNPKK
jgi:hypothetical protein